MQGEIKMDKEIKKGAVFARIESYSRRFAMRFSTIAKISKDNTRIQDTDGIVYPLSRKTAFSKKDIKEFIEGAICHKNFFFALEKKKKYSTIYVVLCQEDDFDDFYNCSIEGVYGNLALTMHFRVNSLETQEIEVEGRNFVLSKNLGELLDYLPNFSPNENLSLLQKFNEWLEKHGFDKTDKLRKDYKGGTEQLEWAIEKDIHPNDYDRWQFVQKILKHELKYETARDIFNTLYEKEDIEIFDCE